MEEQTFDRLPPQHIEAEQAVLGAILIDPDALITASEIVHPADFYRAAHEKIFLAMLNLSERREPVDIVTLTAELQAQESLEDVGGIVYLTQLSNSVPTAANVDHYAAIVHEKAVTRRLIQVATQIASTGYEAAHDVTELLDDAEKKIFSLSQERNTRNFTHIKDVLVDTFERIETLYSNKGAVTGVPTGYPDLDRMLSGFQKSDLIIVAARPSVGKTAFALNISQNVALRTRLPVAIFSLEMSKEQLVQRILCAEGNLDAGRMRTGYLEDDDWPKLSMAVGTLSEAPIYIDDTPGITVSEIRSKCRRLQTEHGLGLILIDYLQLIQGRPGRSENRQQEISEISRTLKGLARELNVPIIALSQLSRSVEQRQDKRPMLSDIRESGSIEQDADVVAFLYRDDYYDKESEKKNIIEIIIAKQRNGPTGTVELVFLKNFNKFVSLEKATS